MRGINTIADVRARCCVDPAPNGCWHWLGATSTDGVPRVYTFDHERGEKRTMSGPKSVWNIAHQRAPLPGWLVYRRCLTTDCLNPVHLADAPNKAAIGLHMRRNGKRKGTQGEQRRAALVNARMAQGIVPTPTHIVHAIRAADPSVRNRSLARQFGMLDQTVSAIRLGKTRVAA